MRINLNSSLKRRHGRLIRAVAIFFLLFTGADIFLPQYFCGDEVAGLPDLVSSSVLAHDLVEKKDAPSLVSNSENSTPGQPSEEQPHEEDCFCCCAHLLMGSEFTCVGVLELATLSIPPSDDSLPSPPLHGTYHPPRFA